MADFIVDTQAETAKFFGVSVETLKLWRKKGCPGMKIRRYELDKIAQWAVVHKSARGDAGIPIAGDDELLDGSSTPALEKYRAEKAKIARLQRLQMESVLVDVAKIETGIRLITSNMREAGDKLQRRYGVEAQEILDEHLDAAENAANELFGDTAKGPESEESSQSDAATV